MAVPPVKSIQLIGVRQNNLKNITVEFPYRKLSVVTGLSGSGKSSLAFDTLYAEGQRRYIESLSTYTRQFLEKMPKPDIDTVRNIPPSIALEQRNNIVNSRSTVGTQTELVDYLRVLYAKIGRTYCMDCGAEVVRIDSQVILEQALKWLPKRKSAIAAPLVAREGSSGKGALESYFRLLREQGLRRLIRFKTKKTIENLDLEEMDDPSFPKITRKDLEDGKLFVVVDRFKLTQADDELRARLLDSIEQALQIGKDRLCLIDLDSAETKEFDMRFACPDCGKEHKLPEPNLFSFNNPLGACPHCSGFGFTLDIDESLVVPDQTKTLKNGAIDPLSKPASSEWQKDFFRFVERHGISIGKRYKELLPAQKKLIWEGDPKDDLFPGVLGYFKELAKKKYKLHVRVFIRRYQAQTLCSQCKSARLRPESLAVKIDGLSIADTLALSIDDAIKRLEKIKLSKTELTVANDILLQVRKRLSFLHSVGVGYLTLARLAKTLSGGEFQRINLATQLGNGLCGTLYVLDEPSIGLHAADNDRLIGVLKDLRDQGNTVVVVEHDLEIMRQADWLVELGPGSGRNGGELIAQGDAKKLQTVAASITGKYLSGAFTVGRVRQPRGPAKKSLKLTGCRENNLKNVTVEFPLERFVVVSGVSGSGKSTLVHKTLHTALGRLFGDSVEQESTGRFDRLYGAEMLTGVVMLDQKPIGKSSRSNPATYLKAWDEIRRIYANQVTALRRGYLPQHFSFNVDGGRCPVCKGEGEITLDMHFMAEIKLPCEECEGRRFKKNVLEVTYRGKNVDQLLHTTIDEATDLFRDNSVLARKLGILRDVGLGYLQIGQPAPTLSGGESQRLKIAAVLDESSFGRPRSQSGDQLLYIFDEPTTGLHMEDIKKLLAVLQDLVDARHSIVMIEHQLDVIAQADWVIDLGPGGGDRGGHVIATGTPEDLAEDAASVTGAALRSAGLILPRREREKSL